MIRNIIPLAFDSFGVRSMATLVETDDARILIDPAVSLAPVRYGLPPHPVEWRRMDEAWERIRQHAEQADALIVTHYHYDHHDPSEPEVYRGKIVYVKHPAESINLSQRNRAAYFLEALKGVPKRLEYADGKETKVGETGIRFSKAVCHGTNPRLGYVTEVSVWHRGEKFVHTSDVEGPSLDDQIQFVLDEKPDVLIVDGPMTYMLGFRYSYKSLESSNRNLVRAIKETSLHTLILDHHFMRDLNYRTRVTPVYDAARSRGVKVQTAAEFAGKRIEMLEALRRELYEKHGAIEPSKRPRRKVLEG